MTDEGSQQNLSDFSMLGLFRMEAESQAAILNEGLLALEENPDATEGIESLMRAAHSIKGAARIVQLEIAVKLAHAMEDCFVAAQDGKIVLGEKHIDALLNGVDIFTKISQASEEEIESWLTENQQDVDKSIQSLQAIQSGEFPTETPDKEKHDEVQAPIVEEPPSSPQKDPKPTKDRDAVVRVTAEKLNRLMGFAGGSLVEVGRLRSFGNSLIDLKKSLADVSDALDNIRDSANELNLSERAEALVDEIRSKHRECSQIFSDRMTEFDMHSRQMDSLTDRLYHEVVSCRMRPFADGVQGFPRMVRDVSKKLDKKVKLEIIGETTDVDRDLLENLEAPLTHLLRNAIDHGIEYPGERLTAGKPEVGTIRLIARHWAGMLYITVADDGKGIDLERLRDKIVNRKLVHEDMAGNLSEAELMEFMFLPGFSTASAITEISGRGVGLDVVQNMVQEVQGVVRADSKPGQGTSFHLQLPITLSVIRALLVEIGGEHYAFPMVRIDRILSVTKEDIHVLENRQYITFENNNIGLVPAHQVLGLGEAKPYEGELPVVVIGDRLNHFGIIVDRFVGERELIINPLDARLGKVADINAAAIMRTGRRYSS